MHLHIFETLKLFIISIKYVLRLSLFSSFYHTSVVDPDKGTVKCYYDCTSLMPQSINLLYLTSDVIKICGKLMDLCKYLSLATIKMLIFTCNVRFPMRKQ